MAIPMGAGAEFDRIRAIMQTLGSRADGLGSDVGYVRAGAETLAVSTDVSVEGVHFRTAWLTFEEIGWRATAAALSDLAAAGAEVLGVLVALTVPASADTHTVSAIMRGADAVTAAAGGRILGGDLSRGESVSVAVTVIGRASRMVSRQGASPGNTLWVTGALGGSHAALAAWERGGEPDAAARARFAHPEPRLQAGRWLAAHGATAMLDLSDGLGSDARHLAAASGVAVAIDLDRIPLDPSVVDAAQASRQPAPLFAASGGEDYELLVTMPAAFEGTEAFPFTRIGTVHVGQGTTFTLQGQPVTPGRYDHFA